MLKSWERKYFVEGGGVPLIFFAVFGEFGDNPSVSRSQYRCAGIPDGITIDKYDEQVHREVRDGFLEGYSWERVQQGDPELAKRIVEGPECLVIRGEPKEFRTLDYLRDVVGFVTYLVGTGGVCVHELQISKWWSPAEWRSKVFAADGPAAHEHVVILVSEEDNSGRLWFHTRGLRQFGRPDLSIHGVGQEHREAVVGLFNRFIKFQALGGVIEEGNEIKMAGLPGGMGCCHKGEMDDPDFNNVHVEIFWPTTDS